MEAVPQRRLGEHAFVEPHGMQKGKKISAIQSGRQHKEDELAANLFILEAASSPDLAEICSSESCGKSHIKVV
jgi:hypothetical protein